MRILRHYTDVPAGARGAAVAIGNFDGVHRGHQAVIGCAAEIAAEASAPLAVLTFEPHPRRFFRPDAPPFRLTPFRAKAHLLYALGVQVMVVQRFDRQFSQLSAEDFVRCALVEGLGVRHVVVGYDFVFGHKRGGDTDLLAQMAKACGFGFTAVSPAASADGEIYSSTRIRDYLTAGKPGHAAALLGRPFEIEGRVVAGERLGRTLGYPTTNLELDDYLHPTFGIYAVRVGLEDAAHRRLVWHDGVASLGVRPTVGGSHPLLETHLFGFDREIYGARIRVALIEFIRPERMFDTLDALRRQIDEDCKIARNILRTRAAGAP